MTVGATADGDALAARLRSVRERTIELLAAVPEPYLTRRVHDFYSPIGWHFGHIGRTEEYWTCHKGCGRPLLDDALSFLFADLPENPKDARVNLPSRAEIVRYLHETRLRSETALREADLGSPDRILAQGFAWDFAVQHECQHQETIAEMLQLIAKDQGPTRPKGEPPTWRSDLDEDRIEIPGGRFFMGTDSPLVYDNERNAHAVDVAGFRLNRFPVTAYQWTLFMDDGGYDRPDLWTKEGWEWRDRDRAICPEYWFQSGGSWAIYGPEGPRWIEPDEPASSLSWFEADAYARWAGRRLPSEEEWEYAAAGARSATYPWGEVLPDPETANFGQRDWRPTPVGHRPNGASWCGVEDLAGGVWEWTSSPFLPYPGFEAFPYDGYSKDHMQGAHRVCRGGSWSTAAPILRCTFRNWYVPTYRQGFLGLRLAG